MHLSDQELRCYSPYLLIPEYKNGLNISVEGIRLSSVFFPATEVDISVVVPESRTHLEYETEIDWSDPLVRRSIQKLKSGVDLGLW